MKTNTSLLIIAAVAMTGCVNWNSFNAANPSQSPAKGSAASAKPAPKAQAKPSASPQPAKTSPARPAAAQPSVTPAAPVATPKPSPASRVIKEERTSETKVISSRPVVGTDAEMGH